MEVLTVASNVVAFGYCATDTTEKGLLNKEKQVGC